MGDRLSATSKNPTNGEGEFLRGISQSIRRGGGPAVCLPVIGTQWTAWVYVYERNHGGPDNWGLVKKLSASGEPKRRKGFGNAVSIWRDTIVVGAFVVDGWRGRAYVYERNHGGPDNWGLVKELVASDRKKNNQFGNAVAVCSDTIVVGAAKRAKWVGAAYAFGRDHGGPGAWGELAILTPSDGVRDGEVGETIAIGGRTVLVGTRGPTHPGAYAFDLDRCR